MPEVITIQKEVFKFEELSDSAKERATEKYNYTNHEGWWEGVYEDFNTIVELMGFTDIVIEFNLSYSQSDYAAFSGRYYNRKSVVKEVKEYAPQDETLHSIAAAIVAMQRPSFYSMSGKFNYGRYGYSIDMEDSRRQYGWPDHEGYENQLREILKDLSKWLYKQLQNDYEHLSSVESFGEHADINEYRFDENGKMI